MLRIWVSQRSPSRERGIGSFVLCINRVLKNPCDYPLDPFMSRREGISYLRDTLRLPAKGLRPSAHPVFQRLLKLGAKVSIEGLGILASTGLPIIVRTVR